MKIQSSEDSSRLILGPAVLEVVIIFADLPLLEGRAGVKPWLQLW